MEKDTRSMGEMVILLPEWDQLPDFGLYMDQIIALMERSFSFGMPKGEMTKAMINNYVKAGLIPRPAGKKYDREHMASLLMIYVLKQALSMEGISAILSMLCRESVKDGYEQFRTRLSELESIMAKGTVALDWSGESREELTLRLGLMAALCTVRTYWILSESADA